MAEGHPVLLDASATEVLGDIETSVSPLLLRGFQLHTVLVPLAEGGNTRNIVSPQFQGGNSSALILYDEETVPPELGPQPPMRISLCAPSQDHWTIVLDTVFPSTIEEYRRLREQAASKPTKAGALPSSSSVAELVELRLLPAGTSSTNGPLHPGPGPCPPNSIHGGLGAYQGPGQDVSRDPHGRVFPCPTNRTGRMWVRV